MAVKSKSKGKPKRKFSKQAIENIRKGAKKRSGKNHRNYSPHKATDGITPATKEEREKYLGLFRDHDYTHVHTGPGAPKEFETPAHLKAAAVEYFKWCEDNPWHKAEWKDKALQSIPVKRVFTMAGLCVRLGVYEEYFHTFENQLRKEDPYYAEFKQVIKWIKNCIYINKYEGASGGFYNSNLISYDLGLRKDQNNAGGTGHGITLVYEEKEHSDLLEEVKKRIQEIDAAAEENV